MELRKMASGETAGAAASNRRSGRRSHCFSGGRPGGKANNPRFQVNFRPDFGFGGTTLTENEATGNEFRRIIRVLTACLAKTWGRRGKSKSRPRRIIAEEKPQAMKA